MDKESEKIFYDLKVEELIELGTFSIKKVLSEFFNKGYILDNGTDKTDNLNIVGWRRKKGLVDSFQDALGVYWSEYGKWVEKVWAITTRPGKPWLLNPMKKSGTAILVPGQYKDVYELGYYKKLLALKEVGKFKVYRDFNKDEKFDEDFSTIEEGYFGMHIHAAGFMSKFVGLSSAGCQVFKDLLDFHEFIQICCRKAGSKENKFTYTLLEF